MLAMGCMRLSTERDRDDARSIEVMHAALDAGVTFSTPPTPTVSTPPKQATTSG